MPLKWLWAGLPLAVLVAILAHATAFGSGHAAGGTYALAIADFLVAAFALRFAARFVSSATVARASFATTADLGKGAFALAGLAALAFAGLEIVEGHDVFGAGIVPALALLPIALAVLVVTRQFDRLAARAVALAAIYLRRARPRLVVTFARRARSRSLALGVCVRRIARGRAPPRFA